MAYKIQVEDKLGVKSWYFKSYRSITEAKEAIADWSSDLVQPTGVVNGNDKPVLNVLNIDFDSVGGFVKAESLAIAELEDTGGKVSKPIYITTRAKDGSKRQDKTYALTVTQDGFLKLTRV